MTNHEIAQLLRNVAASFAIKDEKKFRFQLIAYQKAADSIENATSQVADLYKEQKLDNLPGMGARIKSRLEELMKNGSVSHFYSVKKDFPEAVFPLIGLLGFGPKKAYKLVTAFKLSDPKTVVDDLEKVAKEGKIASLEGFGEKSQSDVLRSINEFRLQKGKASRMLLPFATELAEKMVSYLKTSPNVKYAQPLGSLRRELATIGDLDIAVATDHPTEVIKHFTNYPYKDRVREQGPITASILTSGGKQIDLMTQPTASFGSLLQHFTGSKLHNIHLRDYALKLGLSLSEKGIKHIKEKGEPMKQYATEKEFYSALKMEWIPPEIREDTGEIEMALKNTLPNLIETKDMKGDLHIHSNYPIDPSHDLGRDDMSTMLKRAKELGYSYLGFSEHNPSISTHTKEQIYSILDKRQNYIEQLKKSNNNIRIINLLEIDILASGDLAIDDKSFSYLDAGIVSIHSSLGIDAETMTKRGLKGLSHPKAEIFAHPTGRMLNERPGYTLDWEKIFDFCKTNNKALEINSWPQRLDLPDTLIKQAIGHGVKLVIDTDSHAVGHMDLMRFGVAVGRRGWATKSDVLNSLEYNDFIRWIKS